LRRAGPRHPSRSGAGSPKNALRPPRGPHFGPADTKPIPIGERLTPKGDASFLAQIYTSMAPTADTDESMQPVENKCSTGWDRGSISARVLVPASWQERLEDLCVRPG